MKLISVSSGSPSSRMNQPVLHTETCTGRNSWRGKDPPLHPLSLSLFPSSSVLSLSRGVSVSGILSEALCSSIEDSKDYECHAYEISDHKVWEVDIFQKRCKINLDQG